MPVTVIVSFRMGEELVGETELTEGAAEESYVKLKVALAPLKDISDEKEAQALTSGAITNLI